MLAESCSLPWRLEALLFLWHQRCSEAVVANRSWHPRISLAKSIALDCQAPALTLGSPSSPGSLGLLTLLYTTRGRPDYFRFFLPGAGFAAVAAGAAAASRFKRLRLKLSAMSFDARASRSIGDRFFSSQKRRRHPTGSSRNALTAPETPSLIICTTASLRSGDHDAIV